MRAPSSSRGTTAGGLLALAAVLAVVSMPGPAGAVPTTAGRDDRVRPSLAGRPGWLVARRAVAAMQGAHRVDGELTFTGDRPYRITGDLDPSTGTARVTYDHISKEPDADPAESLPMELRLTATTAYRRLGDAARRELLADWYSFDLTNADPASTPTEVLVAQWFLDAPLYGLDVERWTERAADTVGSVATRHLRGTAALKDTVQLLGSSKGFLPGLTVDLWIDRSGHIRRVRWVASPDPSYRGKRAPRVTLDATYRPLGAPVVVVTKPAGRIIDAKSLYD